MGAETILLASLAGASLLGGTATAIRSNSYAKHSAEEAAAESYERQKELYDSRTGIKGQAQQYADIGVNPASVMSNGSISGSSVPSVDSAHIPNIAQPSDSVAQSFNLATQALSNYKDGRVKDKQAELLVRQIYGQEISNAYGQLNNELLEKYGDKEWSAKLRDLGASAFLKYAQGANQEALYDLNNVIRLVSNEDLGIRKEEAANIALKISKMLALMDAQTQSNRASAFESYQSGLTTQALRPYQTEMSELLNSVQRIDTQTAVETAGDKLDALRERLSADKSLAKKDRVQAEREFLKLERIVRSYRNHPSQLRLDATLKKFNDEFPVLSQFSAFAGAAK